MSRVAFDYHATPERSFLRSVVGDSLSGGDGEQQPERRHDDERAGNG